MSAGKISAVLVAVVAVSGCVGIGPPPRQADGGTTISDEGPAIVDVGVDVPQEDVVQLTREQCAAACGGRTCGPVGSEKCAGIVCGECPTASVCLEGEWCFDPADVRPRWTVRAIDGLVGDCARAWDRCLIGPPLCSPTPPDPQLRFGTRMGSVASNTCTPRWERVLSPPFLQGDLQNGIEMTLFDNDSPATSDVICPRQTVMFTEADFNLGRKEIACGNGSRVTVGLARWTYMP